MAWFWFFLFLMSINAEHGCMHCREDRNEDRRRKKWKQVLRDWKFDRLGRK